MGCGASDQRPPNCHSLIREVALKHKEVAVYLAPPLSGLGFLSPSLAPKEEKPKVPELRIYLAYDLVLCSRESLPSGSVLVVLV